MTPKTQAKVFADADNNGANARLLTTAPADTSFPLARALGLGRDTILPLNETDDALQRLHDLRVILHHASQSPLHTHRERATAMDLIREIDTITETVKG